MVHLYLRGAGQARGITNNMATTRAHLLRGLIAKPGFDVSEPHGAYIYSQIAPLNLSYQENMKECEKLTRIAISTFNSRLKDDIEEELEFVKVVKANYQLIRSSYFYLTFEAVNLGNQKTNTYQAMVESLYDDSGFQVLCCRLKQDSDTNEGKWFWDDRKRGRSDTKGM